RGLGRALHSGTLGGERNYAMVRVRVQVRKRSGAVLVTAPPTLRTVDSDSYPYLLPMTLLVLLARAAGTGIVAAHRREVPGRLTEAADAGGAHGRRDWRRRWAVRCPRRPGEEIVGRRAGWRGRRRRRHPPGWRRRLHVDLHLEIAVGERRSEIR